LRVFPTEGTFHQPQNDLGGQTRNLGAKRGPAVSTGDTEVGGGQSG